MEKTSMDAAEHVDFFKEGEPAPLLPFKIFGWEPRFYTVAFAIAILVSFITVRFFWKREGYPISRLISLTSLCVLSIVVGARLFFIFERLIYSPNNPFPRTAWYKIWEGGLSLQGGIILPPIVLTIWLLLIKEDIDIRVVFSIITPAVMLGFGIGRWGNFTNHEVIGKQVDANHPSLAWLPEIIRENMHLYGAIRNPQGIEIGVSNKPEYYVPLFFYDFIAQTVGYIIIVWIFNLFGWFKPGATGGLFFIWEGVLRIIMEPLRSESYSLYSDLAVLFLVAGIILFVYFEFEDQIKGLFQFRPKPRYLAKKEGYWIRYIRISRLNTLNPAAVVKAKPEVETASPDDNNKPNDDSNEQENLGSTKVGIGSKRKNKVKGILTNKERKRAS